MRNKPATRDGEAAPAVPDSDAPSRVVGIGASAGGLEAVSELLRHLPNNTGMAFVFIQHLEPRQTSRLTDILSRITEMPVEVASDRLRMIRNHIYVMPPGVDITLSDGLLILERRTESAGRHLPIDYFFHSLAKEQGNKAVAIILSGMGHDGSAGLKSIKGQGGTTFAQDEPSAQHGSMPAAAIDSGFVDIVTAPRKIAAELVRLAQDRPARGRRKRAVAENGLKNIFALLRSRTEVDFSQYRKTTVRRRIQRRMLVQRIEDVDHYFTFLKRNPEEVDALFREMLIHVTGFFREPETFDVLQSVVLPRLLEKRQNDPIRIWLPGCSTGEEAYSLAIIVTEFFDSRPESPAIQIFATDVSDRVLEIARKGVFDASIESATTKERLRRFFSKNERGYQINKQIRDLCVFARQNVLRDPPFSRLDLISCRNVLIYFETAAQKKLIPFFHYALKPGGFLLLGGAETVGNFSDLFEPVDSKTKLFAKRSVQSPSLSSMEVEIPGPKEQALRDFAAQSALMQPDIRRDVDRALMDKYCPPTIVVDNAMKIIQFRGNVAPFLDPDPGEASLDLFRMLRSNLEMPLRSAISDSKKSNTPARKEGILFQGGNGQASFLNLEVIPMSGSALRDRCFLLLFEDGSLPVSEATVPKSKKGRGNLRDARVSQLEQELATTREQLQTLIEEQESTNEELRSANEEIQSSNEELQSTNEELETAKEELQSTNEELITLNEELKSGNVELTEVNNDLTNLLKSVSIPIVMVDRGLRIRRFTPVAQRTLKLIPADVGRSITDLRADVEVSELETLISDVMDTLSMREVAVQDRKGHWYNLQIRPYETADNKITGAVMILFDINAAKLESDRSKVMLNYADAFIGIVRSSVVVLDNNLRVKTATSHFYKAFRLLPKETEGLSIFEVGNGQWNFPEFHALLEERLPHESSVTDWECEHQFQRLGQKRLKLNVRQVEETSPEDRLVIISFEEVA